MKQLTTSIFSKRICPSNIEFSPRLFLENAQFPQTHELANLSHNSLVCRIQQNTLICFEDLNLPFGD